MNAEPKHVAPLKIVEFILVPSELLSMHFLEEIASWPCAELMTTVYYLAGTLGKEAPGKANIWPMMSLLVVLLARSQGNVVAEPHKAWPLPVRRQTVTEYLNATLSASKFM